MIQIIKMDKVVAALIHWIFSKEWLNWTNRKIQLKNIFFITSYHHRLSSWWLEVVVWSKWNILKERKIETSGRCICVFCCWLSSFSSYWFVAVALQPFESNTKTKQKKEKKRFFQKEENTLNTYYSIRCRWKGNFFFAVWLQVWGLCFARQKNLKKNFQGNDVKIIRLTLPKNDWKLNCFCSVVWLLLSFFQSSSTFSIKSILIS